MKTTRTAMALLSILTATPAVWAQTSPRFQAGPVARVEKIAIEGGAGGVSSVAGISGGVRLTKHLSIEGDVTKASSRFERSYSGTFISFAPPSATREEIERQGVVVKRDLAYVPGLGASLALAIRSEVTNRVDLTFRAGIAARQYLETTNNTILQGPEGIDPARYAFLDNDERHKPVRGGFLFGLDVPIKITSRLQLGPEVRFVSSGPARIRHKHREASLGTRVMWRF